MFLTLRAADSLLPMRATDMRRLVFLLAALIALPACSGGDGGFLRNEQEFGDIEYNKAGTYEYTVNEVIETVDGYTFDDTVYEVTVTVTPATGYKLDAISVKDASDNAVSVSNGKFTMPASAVSVTASFSKIDYAVTTATVLTGGSASSAVNINNIQVTIAKIFINNPPL